jgi:hypothetical protein
MWCHVRWVVIRVWSKCSLVSSLAGCKTKAVPLPPCKCQWGRRYSSYSFLSSALDGGDWSASRSSRALPLGKYTLCALDGRLGGPQRWSVHRGYRTNPLPLQMLRALSFCLVTFVVLLHISKPEAEHTFITHEQHMPWPYFDQEVLLSERK